MVKFTSKELFRSTPNGISHTIPLSKYVSLVPFKESDNSRYLLFPFSNCVNFFKALSFISFKIVLVTLVSKSIKEILPSSSFIIL